MLVSIVLATFLCLNHIDALVILNYYNLLSLSYNLTVHHSASSAKYLDAIVSIILIIHVWDLLSLRNCLGLILVALGTIGTKHSQD